MGFEIPVRALLEFREGTLLEGANVRVKLNMQIRDFVGLQRVLSGLSSDLATLSDKDLDRWDQAFREFARDVLIDWDLVVDGAPVSADEDGFIGLGFRIDSEVFLAWASLLGGPAPNSAAVSASGALSEAESVLTGQS